MHEIIKNEALMKKADITMHYKILQRDSLGAGQLLLEETRLDVTIQFCGKDIRLKTCPWVSFLS